MKSHSHPHLTAETLPPAYTLLLDILRGSPTPLTAYALLEQCRGNGPKTPMQIYRILDRLIAFKLVHKIEKINRGSARAGSWKSSSDPARHRSGRGGRTIYRPG
jgi:hypothetical protein